MHLQDVSSFEKGKSFTCGKLDVLVLNGSYREMGRQYGKLLQQPLGQFYQEAIVEHFMYHRNLSLEVMLAMGHDLFKLYPKRLKEILVGMAETSGLDLDQHLVLNALELFGPLEGCSCIAVWGDYTSREPLVFGRNYDWFPSYSDFARTLTVTILNPPSSVPTAIVTFAGVIYATTGMNKNGLFLALNNGQPSGGELIYSGRIQTMVMLLSFLLDADSMEQLDAAFQTTNSHFSYIINVADPSAAFSYEWPPFAIRRREGVRNGVLASTNQFINPEWKLQVVDSHGMETVKRRENLLRLAEKNKGRINAERMMEMMDIPIDRGGPTWPQKAQWKTVYQVVAVPEKRELFLKVPGYQDWTGVSLQKLFI